MTATSARGVRCISVTRTFRVLGGSHAQRYKVGVADAGWVTDVGWASQDGRWTHRFKIGKMETALTSFFSQIIVPGTEKMKK